MKKSKKKRLKQGETLNGSWLNLGSVLTADMIAAQLFPMV